MSTLHLKTLRQVLVIIAICTPFIVTVSIIALYFKPVIHHEIIESYLKGFGPEASVFSGHDMYVVHRWYAFMRWLNPRLATPYPLGFYLGQAYSVTCLALSAAGAYVVLRKNASVVSDTYLPMFCVMVFLFSASQWENWTGSAIPFYFTTLMFMSGLLSLLYVRGVFGFVLAATAAYLGTFGLGSGLVIWLALLPVLVRRSQGFRKWFGVTTWLLLFLSASWFFFEGNEAATTAVSDMPTSVRTFIRYFVTLIGAPLSPNVMQAFAAGVGLCVAAGYLIIRNAKSASAWPWVCVLLYGMFSAAVITAGRFSGGIAHALSSRYTSITAFVLIGLVGVLHSTKHPWRQQVFWLLALMGIAANVAWFQSGYPSFAHRAFAFVRGQACLETYWYAPSWCLQEIHWDVENARKAGEKLVHEGVITPFVLPDDAMLQTDPSLAVAEVNLNNATGTAVIQGEAALPGCEYADSILLTVGDNRTPVAYTRPFRKRMDDSFTLDCGRLRTRFSVNFLSEEVARLQGQAITVWLYDTDSNILWRASEVRVGG